MDKIQIEVTGNIARVTQKPTKLTSGTVGLPAEFTFDEQWDGLKKMAVFRAGDVKKTVDIPDGETTVPWEVMDKPKVWLSTGVYGINDDGTVVIPTIWANVSVIRSGVDIEGDDPTDPEAPIWKTLTESVEEAIANANDAAEEAREAAENCIGGGGKVLNVWVEGDEADHTSSEIYDHVSNNRGPVLLHCDGGFYQLLHVEDGGPAYFGYIADEHIIKVVLIGSNSVERYEHWFASPDYVNDSINEAIGNLVKTVNGIAPDENGNVEIEAVGAGVFYVDIVPRTDSPEYFEIVANWDDVENAYNSGMGLVLRRPLYHSSGIMVGYKTVPLSNIKTADGELVMFVFNDRGELVEHALIKNDKYVMSFPYKITDSSFSVEGKPADAKAVGEEFGNISTALDHIIALQEELIG